ncbi:hypothetical protein BCR39DRAFT_325346 [Naematelia encephala]|uniref:Uncharacterized protein n=1 Tax=Naematelia encephala TaxID=71784 RepID=A0A1Y2ANY3_9TREE|nr:hypothetical protein BCR39DRAFT_325346 [Naematelia encephala]
MIRDSHTMLVPPQRPIFTHPSPNPHSHSHSLATPPPAHHLTTPPPLTHTHSSQSFFPQTPRSIPPITTPPSTNNLNPIMSRPNPINPCSRSNSSKFNINGNKKLSASTNTKHKAVQLALEQKVDKAKGFHAFFVPLARPIPNAPPSSPVLHPQCTTTTTTNMMGQKEKDYFGKWHEHVTGPKGSQQWVEDVDDSMQLDSD